MFFLVDYENVCELGLDALDVLTEKDHLIVFYSGNASINGYKIDTIRKSRCAFDVIKLINKGDNALDFYIAVKVGQILESDPGAEIRIISKDSGFKAVVDYVNRYANCHSVHRAPTISQSLPERQYVSLDDFLQIDSREITTENKETRAKEKTRQALLFRIKEIIGQNNGEIAGNRLCQLLNGFPEYKEITTGQKKKFVYLKALFTDELEVFKNKRNTECVRIAGEEIEKSIRIEDIGLQKAQVKALKEAGFCTFQDIEKKGNVKELIKIRGIGKATVKKITGRIHPLFPNQPYHLKENV